MERKLASIQRIREIRDIPGADAIQVAVVNSWTVVIKKGEFQKGDLCIYFEIDSFLPVREEFEFLRKSSYRKLPDGTEGFRLRTVKLRGQISQGLILPISVLNSQVFPEMQVGISKQPWGDQLQLGPYDDALVIEEGVDVSHILQISKYEAPIPAELSGKVKGPFPSFISKTDEERIQNLTDSYDAFRKEQLFVTEKLDGSSATFYYQDGEFGVCSRNLDLLETPDNTFWKVARELRIEEKLSKLGGNYALQGELVGEGVQGNPYKIKGQTVKIFNIYSIDDSRYLSLEQMRSLLLDMNLDGINLEIVPVFQENFKLPEKIEELLAIAIGQSHLNPQAQREGLVVRNDDKTISFKVISNAYLLNEKN